MWYSFTGPRIEDVQMPLPAFFLEGSPISLHTRLLSSRQSSLTASLPCSAPASLGFTLLQTSLQAVGGPSQALWEQSPVFLDGEG